MERPGQVSGREAILGRVRAALGRKSGQKPLDVPPVRYSPSRASGDLVEIFTERLAALGVKPHVSDEPCRTVEAILGGRDALASQSTYLEQVGILALRGVSRAIDGDLRELCAHASVGITSAHCCLADTGSLVMLSNSEEARMISLLPPTHIAVVPRACILSSLDELLKKMPLPADQTSSLVLITGTSKTGDIEQILVRGVHGPGEVHVVVT